MFELITSNDNKRINEHLDKLQGTHIQQIRIHLIETNNKGRVEKFIELIYFRVMYGMNHHNVEFFFKSGIGADIFGATMSQQRIRFLLAHIPFDDKSTRKDRWPCDRFAAGRDIFEMFDKNCSKYVIPFEYIAINETYPMRHQIAFRQYNRKKPHKYRLILKPIYDSYFLFYLQSCSLC